MTNRKKWVLGVGVVLIVVIAGVVTICAGSNWYTHPDWWVAIFTGALVLVTGVLAYFTLKLWSSTSKAILFEEAASIPRLYPRVVSHNLFSKFNEAARAHLVSPYTFTPQVDFNFDNYGKSPALVEAVRFKLHLADVRRESKILPSDLDVFPFPVRGTPVIEPGKQSIIYACKYDEAVSMNYDEYLRVFKSIPGKRYYLVIEIDYKDVFGTHYSEGFTLKGMPPKCDVFERRGGFKKVERSKDENIQK